MKRSRLLADTAEREKKIVAASGWAIIVGFLLAWLTIGTICIIQVLSEHFFK